MLTIAVIPAVGLPGKHSQARHAVPPTQIQISLRRSTIAMPPVEAKRWKKATTKSRNILQNDEEELHNSSAVLTRGGRGLCAFFAKNLDSGATLTNDADDSEYGQV